MDDVVLPAAAPLGGLPSDLEAKVVARIRAGYPPQSADHPRRVLWKRTVVPGVVLVVVDAVAAVVAFAGGYPALGVGALILLVVFVAIVLGQFCAFRRDPLRLDAAERDAVSLACGWRSSYSHDPAVRDGADAAGRVVACAAWWSPLLDEHRARLDLRRFLDALDLAGRDDLPAARDRAAALSAYATGLEAMVTKHGAGETVRSVPRELDRLVSDRLSS